MVLMVYLYTILNTSSTYIAGRNETYSHFLFLNPVWKNAVTHLHRLTDTQFSVWAVESLYDRLNTIHIYGNTYMCTLQLKNVCITCSQGRIPINQHVWTTLSKCSPVLSQKNSIIYHGLYYFAL